MSQKELFVVDSDDDDDWGEEFKVIPNVPVPPIPISMEKEVPNVNLPPEKPVSPTPEKKSNIFEKYLDDSEEIPEDNQETKQALEELAATIESDSTLNKDFSYPIEDPMSIEPKEIVKTLQESLQSPVNSQPKNSQENESIPIVKREIPELKEDIEFSLKKEVLLEHPDVDYIRRCVMKTMTIPTDIRKEIWCLLLNVDMSMVNDMKAKSTWNIEINDYTQYIHYYIKEKVNQISMDNRDSVTEYLQWITDGYLTITQSDFSPYVLNLALLLHSYSFPRETALCCILRLYANTYIDGKHSCIYSNTDGYNALDMHQMFKLLLKYHSPTLYHYLNTVSSSWYNPTYKFNDYKPPEIPQEVPTTTEGPITLLQTPPSPAIPLPELPKYTNGFINTDYLYRGYLYTNLDIDGCDREVNIYLYDYMIIEGNCTLYLFIYLAMLLENEDKLVYINKENMEIYLNNIYTNYKSMDTFSHILSYAVSLRSLTPATSIPAILSLYSQSSCLIPRKVEGNYEIWNKRMTLFYFYFNTSKISRVSSLLKQWNGQEHVFEQSVLKTYHVSRVLSRDIYYIDNDMANGNISQCISLCISPVEIVEKVIYKKDNRDIDHHYFLIDLREDIGIQNGYIANSFQIEPQVWKKPLQLEGYMNTLNTVKNESHIVLVPWGCPTKERRDEENELISLVYQNLFSVGFTYVSICKDGYYGIHEYIRKHKDIDYILDHKKETCQVCAFYKYDDMLNLAKEKTEQFISSASNTVSSLSSTIKKQLPTEEATKQGLKTVGKKAGNLFTSAYSWGLKQKDTWIKEKENREKQRKNSNVSTQSIDSAVTTTSTHSTNFVIEEEEDDETDLTPAHLLYLSLVEGSKFLKSGDSIETKKYTDNDGMLFKVENVTALFTNLEENTIYYYMLFGGRLLLLHSDPNVLGKAIVVNNWPAVHVKRLTFMKNDKNTLTLYILIEGKSETEILRGKFDDTEPFVTKLQVIIQEEEKRS
ncbi:hypothetical protein WA158_008075 [Blastocystis sp. Blastoise]